MAKKQKNGSGSGKNPAAVRMLIGSAIIAVIAVVFVVFSRGYINYANRMDFIARLLEDLPGHAEKPPVRTGADGGALVDLRL